MNTYKFSLIIILTILIFTPLLPAKENDLTAQELSALGKALFKQKKYVEAKDEFQKCLLINPRHSEAEELLELCETKLDSKKEEAMLLALEGIEKKSEKTLTALNETRASEEKAAPAALPKEAEEENESLIPPLQKGAWTLKKGQIYAEIYTKYFWHNHQFNNNRKKKRWDFDGKGDEISTEWKLEYGLADTDTLLLSAVAKEAHWKDSFTSNTKKGFTEVKTGVKHLLFTDPFICSSQLRVKFPLHYSEEAVPALSTHQIDVETRILTAQPWPKLPGYTKFESGFTFRSEERSNEIPYFFEFGYNAASSLILKTTLDGKIAVGNGIKEDLLKYTIGPIFKLKGLFNIEFGFGHTFAGRNTSAAKEVFTTLSRQW